MGAPRLSQMTLEEWWALPDDSRAELIEGELVHKALPSVDHSFAQKEIFKLFSPEYDHGGGGGGVGPGGWWLLPEIHVAYPKRPNGFILDLAGWKRERHPERPRGARMRMRPDWVCEIVSSNRPDDLVKKRRVLSAEGVEWYWLVDLRDRALIAMKRGEVGYVPYCELTSGERARIEPFDAAEIDTSAMFDWIPRAEAAAGPGTD